jgi:hypothetical protein
MERASPWDYSQQAMSTPAVRASISFPPWLYETLEDIAKQKKVSLISWLGLCVTRQRDTSRTRPTLPGNEKRRTRANDDARHTQL